MNGNRPSSRSADMLEEPVHRTHSQPPTTKRKGSEDANPLNAATKKLKREGSKGANKRKLNGEEQPGGLVIVRAPSVHPPSRNGDVLHAESTSQSRPSSLPPSSQVFPSQPSTSSGFSRQPSKKFRADGPVVSARAVGKSKDREVFHSNRAEPEVDEDVRLMQSEADILRRRSQVAEQSVNGLNHDVQFFPSKSPRPPRNHDTSVPVPMQETPQIERNRFMRGEEPNHRRKRSLSRGKRISSSYENTGVISHPHTSVSDTTFHKHIDGDIPEPQRICQLLIWCAHRATAELIDPPRTPPDQPQASSSRREPKKSGKDPPPIPADAAQVLKKVEEGILKMLAEKQIDTNVYSQEDARPPRPLKENEQNVKNRAREARFNAHNQRSKAEDVAWSKVQDHYNGYRTEVLDEINRLESSKAKGKQRASLEQMQEWDIHDSDLPPHFRGDDNVGLARKIIASSATHSGQRLKERLQELEYSMDRLHAVSNSTLQTTRLAEMDLDRRFALLNISIASRSAPHTSLPSSSTALSTYLPPSLGRPAPTTDPQDLLRALSRVDAQRPQAQVGDAARRAAREVQRATDASAGGLQERRLTGVPPPTPRKPPGTPRRATTPGKGR